MNERGRQSRNVEVNFRFPELGFDEGAERRRSSFNRALQNLNRPNASKESIDDAVETMQDLSRQKFPPAMYIVGGWKVDGEHVPKNSEDGLALLQKAADKNYGPALYEIGIRQVEGCDLARGEGNGLDLLRQAATLGSLQAQFHLGNAV